MAFYQFTKTQKLPSDIETVWAFISNPENLKKITPAYMDFKVTSTTGGDHVYAGMIITYIVKPIMGVPVKWMTEITKVKDYEYFVDEQRSGPYKFWHHQHKIEAIDGGVLMTDIVTYIPPYGLIGRICNSLFIRKQLENIFNFRKEVLEDIFGKYR